MPNFAINNLARALRTSLLMKAKEDRHRSLRLYNVGTSQPTAMTFGTGASLVLRGVHIDVLSFMWDAEQLVKAYGRN